MVQPASLSALKSWQLKHAAFLMGLPSTGTKAALGSLIRQRLQTRNSKATYRVLSVDMGIKNLAYCVLNVPRNSSPDETALTASTWQKRDLTTAQQSSPEALPLEADEGEENSRPSTRTRRQRLETPVIRALDPNIFTPSTLSKIAHSVTTEILSYCPDIILIERQRFRSGGAAAIQEWTVRVNMLESMLWACLRTLQHLHPNNNGTARPFPSIHEVNPARVAQFWNPSQHLLLAAQKSAFDAGADMLGDSGYRTREAPAGREKVQKKDKIAVARRWLAGKDRDVVLDFEGQAAGVAKLFGTNGRARSLVRSTVDVGKLDDLADCLLQGVAWIRWEENAAKLRQILNVD